MSEEQHLKDIKEDLPHDEKGEGACLNRHLSGTPKDTDGKACSHRWQSYLATKSRKKDYNWDKYKSLAKSSGTVATDKNTHTNFPPWYTSTIAAPQEGDWDVKGDNFYTKCTIPYWHEAHHAIPNSTLRGAIVTATKDFDAPGEAVTVIRKGLLEEKYNLNHKTNMITLPMDTKVSNAIKLPRHRKTIAVMNHPCYNKYVAGLLEPIFAAIKKQADEHKTPEYKPLKSRLNSLSKKLIKEIRASMTGIPKMSLEDLAKK